MNIIFAGTAPIAVPSLRKLAAHFNVVAVLSTPDAPASRKRIMQSSSVKQVATELGIPGITPPSLNLSAREQISKFHPDLLVVFAYGRIFGPKFLALFPLGGINIHPSALPVYRGPAPVHAAIINGDSETAITIQRVALQMDAGNIIRSMPIKLNGDETTSSLTQTISDLSPNLLIEVVEQIEKGNAADNPQQHSQATYTRPVKASDGIIDWSKSSLEIERTIRACIPWPKAHTSFNEKRLNLLEAGVSDSREAFLSAAPQGTAKAENTVSAIPIPGTILSTGRQLLVQTGNGILQLRRLQLASRRSMDALSFQNGQSIEIGMVLGGSGLNQKIC